MTKPKQGQFGETLSAVPNGTRKNNLRSSSKRAKGILNKLKREKMTRKFFLGLTTGIATIAAAIVTVSSVSTNPTQSDLLTKNLEALTQNEEGSNEVPGFFLNCADGGVEIATIPDSGTLTILGITISGTKGRAYMVTWERWECESGGDGCDSSKGGVITSASPLY